jgi:hypothetical protein
MTGIWNFALHVLNTLPPWLAACLIGWAGSIAITQPAKFVMPLRWDGETRAIVARVLASLSAFVVTGLAYLTVAPEAPGAAVLLAAMLTGIWSPIAYALLVGGLRTHPRTAWAADVLSGDVRGVLAGKPRSES